MARVTTMSPRTPRKHAERNRQSTIQLEMMRLTYFHLSIWCVRFRLFERCIDCNRMYVTSSASVSSPLTPVQYDGQPVECSWTIDGGKYDLYLLSPLKSNERFVDICCFCVIIVCSSYIFYLVNCILLCCYHCIYVLMY